MLWSRLLRRGEGIVGLRRGTPLCRRHSGCAQQSFAIGGFRFDAGWESRGRVLEVLVLVLRAELALMQQKVEGGVLLLLLYEEGGRGGVWCKSKMGI